jgi:GNAT superfamily N-acetyltransferase
VTGADMPDADMTGADMPGDDLLLRPMQPDEPVVLADLHLASRTAAAASGTMPAPVPRPRADVVHWFTTEVVPHREVWVAEASARPVGLLVLDTTFLDQLYVLPEFAGVGVGTALLELAMALRPDGFELWVFAVNTRARRLYERHGLVAVEFTDGAGNEEGAPDVRYAWRPRRNVPPDE